MTDLDLDAINSWCGLSAYCDWVAATDDARSEPCDVHRVVAALREARAEAERLALVVTSLTAMVEAKSSWIDGARIDIDGLEAERDDARAEADRLTGALGAIAALPSASKPVRDIARDALLDVRHDPSATVGDEVAVASYAEERRKFQAETLTTSYLAGLLRSNRVRCTACGLNLGDGVRIESDDRMWFCAPCRAGEPPCGCARVGTLVVHCEQHQDRGGAWREDDPSATTDGGAG